MSCHISNKDLETPFRYCHCSLFVIGTFCIWVSPSSLRSFPHSNSWFSLFRSSSEILYFVYLLTSQKLGLNKAGMQKLHCKYWPMTSLINMKGKLWNSITKTNIDFVRVALGPMFTLFSANNDRFEYVPDQWLYDHQLILVITPWKSHYLLWPYWNYWLLLYLQQCSMPISNLCPGKCQCHSNFRIKIST